MFELATKAHNRRHPSAGMTLVELLVAISLSMILSAVVLTFYLTFAKATLVMSDYAEFDSETGKLIQNFSRDVREAEGITWVKSNSFKLLKKGIDYTYRYNPTQQTVELSIPGQTNVTLASNVSDLDFIAYDITGTPIAPSSSFAPLNENTKMLQVVGQFSKHTTAGTPTTARIASARYILRNKEAPIP